MGMIFLISSQNNESMILNDILYMTYKKRIMITLMDSLTDIQLDNLLSELDKIKGYQFSLDSLDLVMRKKRKSKRGRDDFNNAFYTGKLFDIKPEIIPIVKS